MMEGVAYNWVLTKKMAYNPRGANNQVVVVCLKNGQRPVVVCGLCLSSLRASSPGHSGKIKDFFFVDIANWA